MTANPAGLFDAHDLIKQHLGSGKSLRTFGANASTHYRFISTAAAFVFALALLCAGQTSSITATLAGQLVSEGFIEWSISVSPNIHRCMLLLILDCTALP